MGRINKTKVNFNGLSELINALDKKVSIRVGILGEAASAIHPGTDLTNAELGAVHEFGATINHPGGTPYLIKEDGRAQFVSKDKGKKLPKTKPHQIIIPTRSFLRMPLMSADGKKVIINQVIEKLHQDPFLEEFLRSNPSKNEINNTYREAIKEKIPKDLMNDIANVMGEAARDRVLEAFDKDGFGNWKPTTVATRKRRKGSATNPTLEDNGDLRKSITFEVKEL